MDGGAWWATVHGVTKSQTRLSDFTFTHKQFKKTKLSVTKLLVITYWWFSGKESSCNAGDLGSIPGWGRSRGEGNGNPLQYSCLENAMDRGAWQATVQGVAKS